MLAGILFFLTACGMRTVTGEGPLVSRNASELGLQSPQFTTINIEGAYSVSFRLADTFNVNVEMQENLFKHQSVSVQGNELRIRAMRNFSTTEQNRPRIIIGAPQLHGITLSGAVGFGMLATETIWADNFYLRTSGASTASLNLNVSGTLTLNSSGATIITLGGRADTANIEASGAGLVNALHLETRQSIIRASGAVVVETHATQTLNITASGASRVRYRGEPTITQTLSGTARVEQVFQLGSY